MFDEMVVRIVLTIWVLFCLGFGIGIIRAGKDKSGWER
jgi:hypothetical protein